MGELLDRPYQRHLLQLLSEHYPRQAQIVPDDGDERKAGVNLAYLAEHGLIEATLIPTMGPGPVRFSNARITARGLDFLADDGGLSAILGVVTIKLADDDLRRLLIEKLQGSDVEPGVKKRLLEKVKELPGDALGAIFSRLFEAGLDAVSVENITKLIG